MELTHRLSLRPWLLLAGLGAILFLVSLGSNRVLTFHETCLAVPAKEMIQSGNYLTTTYAGVPFNHKPPIGHWVIAAMILLFQSEGEFVVRFPFALSAIATALVMARLAAQWHGERIGVITCLIQLTIYYSQMQGRLAEADILACFFVCSAIAAFLHATMRPNVSREPSSWNWQLSPLFYFLTGCAFLTKGPLPLGMILGPCLLLPCFYFLASRGRKAVNSKPMSNFETCSLDDFCGRALRFLFNPVGIVVGLMVVFAWPIAAYRQHPDILQTWIEHNFQRFAGKYSGGDKPPFYYVYTLPMLLAPWTFFAAYGIWIGWKRGEFRAIRWQFLLLWFVLGFTVLSSSAWQHKHYLIPVLPLFSIFAAVGIENVWQKLSTSNFDSRRTISVSRLFCTKVMQPRPLFGTVIAASVAVHVWAIPAFDSYRDQTLFAKRISEKLDASRPVFLLELPVSQLAYYVKPQLVRMDRVEKFVEAIPQRNSSPVSILAPRSVVNQLSEFGRVEMMDECETIRKIMNEEDRLTLAKFTPWPIRVANQDLGTSRH